VSGNVTRKRQTHEAQLEVDAADCGDELFRASAVCSTAARHSSAPSLVAGSQKRAWRSDTAPTRPRPERKGCDRIGWCNRITTGVELTIAVRWRRHGVGDSEHFYDDPFEHAFGQTMMRRRPAGELAPEVLRFGVQFSDGRKATTVGGLPLGDGDDADEEPTGPVLMLGGGGGGEGEWDSDFWLWPLPPPGPLTFAVEWPSAQIELTKHEVDATLILEASALSEQLWPEEAVTEDSGWSSQTQTFLLESRAHPSSESKREDDGEDRSR
jgi:hypothetical protein